MLLTLPPLDAIRGFVAVARRMSITLAAKDLCLTQSAVGRQIQNLEEHLGAKLLFRTHRAIDSRPRERSCCTWRRHGWIGCPNLASHSNNAAACGL